MIKRVVKLTIKKENEAEFSAIFLDKMNAIRSQPGCNHLEFWKDEEREGVFFTYSFWENQEAIDTYKKTELFGEIWPKVKTFFSTKPEAYSVKELVTVQ